MDSTYAAMPDVPREEERGIMSRKFAGDMKHFISNVKFSRPIPPPSNNVTVRSHKKE